MIIIDRPRGTEPEASLRLVQFNPEKTITWRTSRQISVQEGGFSAIETDPTFHVTDAGGNSEVITNSSYSIGSDRWIYRESSRAQFLYAVSRVLGQRRMAPGQGELGKNSTHIIMD